MVSDATDRQSFFWPFVMVVVALIAGCIWSSKPARGPNTKSRWDTVWSLVEFGTYQIFDTKEEAEKYGHSEQYFTIDKVAFEHVVFFDFRRLRFIIDEREDYCYYSSKPPLLPTVIAGYVYLLKFIVGQEFGNKSIQIYTKTVLYTFQLLPFVIFLVLYRRFLDRYVRTDFAWYFCLISAALGTFVTGYLVTLNNHVIAASFAFMTAYLLIGIWYEDKREWWRFALAGLFAGWTVANELPAGLLVIVSLAVVFRIDKKKTLLGFLPPLVVITVAFFVTNYLAIGSLIPAYLHEDAYKYPGSYWAPEKIKGIDALNLAENNEELWVYFLNMTIGHKGLFSLTPIWILAAWGVIRYLRSQEDRTPGLHWPILFISIGVFCFFWLFSSQRNYGGGGHGMRWLMWMSTLWLLMLPSAIDRMAASRKARTVAWACLAISIFSMANTFNGPWGKSWQFRMMEYFEVIDY